ncbi:ATP-binding protein [Cupriavidus metallidurans]|uniref:ATP-binding protein n=1 Tax=Cupriavidus metallidurans TaxID=119219 RepID=UPI001F179AFC|nr:ATP-binding protein [Cupriavidus metallidurans]
MEILETRTTTQESGQMGPSEKLHAIRKLLTMGHSSALPRENRVCPTHGQFESVNYPFGWSNCHKCESEKIAREDQERRDKIVSDFKASQIEQLMRRAAIPARFMDRRLSNYVPQCEAAKKALLIASNYADNFELACETGASLILCGGVGTGKTHLAIGIAHEILARDKSAVFTSVMSAIRRVKETYSRDSDEQESVVIDMFTRPDLLILDEVGVQFGSDTEKLILFEIINGRYERMRPTIVISNLAKDALAQFIGERAFDRLREGGGKLIAFDWPSYRRQV